MGGRLEAGFPRAEDRASMPDLDPPDDPLDL